MPDVVLAERSIVLALSEMNWKSWIFAAKTTAAALIALLVAFTFNLDQPQWILLTVFIVAQPRRDGAVLGKSFYRIIGTFAGATVALVLVALVAQERVLFLGGLALWIGVCTLGSQYARSWSAYSFVLSGYTAAIVGIPGALDAGDAFYIAVARVTEICLGIIVSATIAHIILPDSMATSLDGMLAEGRRRLVGYAVAVLTAGESHDLHGAVLKDTFVTEDLLRSAIFEDRRIRETSARIRAVVGASIDVLASGQPLERQLEDMQRLGGGASAALERARNEALDAARAWQAGQLSAVALSRRLDNSNADLERRSDLGSGQSPDRCLSEFFAALGNYALAYDAVQHVGPGPNSGSS